MKKSLSKTMIACMVLLGLSFNNLIQAQQTVPSGAQTESSKFAAYRAAPLWKDMLDDPNANYFEVQKAYQLFWEGKEAPEDEDAVIGEHRIKNNMANRVFNAKELNEQKERDALSFDCKKYHWWLIKNEPYVRDDGSIMSPEQRLELWRKHNEELSEQTK
jgi:hypothetical protein